MLQHIFFLIINDFSMKIFRLCISFWKGRQQKKASDLTLTSRGFGVQGAILSLWIWVFVWVWSLQTGVFILSWPWRDGSGPTVFIHGLWPGFSEELNQPEIKKKFIHGPHQTFAIVFVDLGTLNLEKKSLYEEQLLPLHSNFIRLLKNICLK